MIAPNLSKRLDKLEATNDSDAQLAIWIQMRPLDNKAAGDQDSIEAAKARWLAAHPDRRAELERADALGRVRFIQHVIVDPVQP